MSEKSLINKVIKDNYKIKEVSILQADSNTQETKKDEDNSFNQLLSLQLLIQKHSGLKDLCKNSNILLIFCYNSHKREGRCNF